MMRPLIPPIAAAALNLSPSGTRAARHDSFSEAGPSSRSLQTKPSAAASLES
jgi:hypothetical protein